MPSKYAMISVTMKKCIITSQLRHNKRGYAIVTFSVSHAYCRCFRSKLLEAGASLDVQDFDGWMPIHAAAHWGQEEACKVLAENLCNMDTKNNNVGIDSKLIYMYFENKYDISACFYCFKFHSKVSLFTINFDYFSHEQYIP